MLKVSLVHQILIFVLQYLGYERTFLFLTCLFFKITRERIRNPTNKTVWPNPTYHRKWEINPPIFMIVFHFCTFMIVSIKKSKFYPSPNPEFTTNTFLWLSIKYYTRWFHTHTHTHKHTHTHTHHIKVMSISTISRKMSAKCILNVFCRYSCIISIITTGLISQICASIGLVLVCMGFLSHRLITVCPTSYKMCWVYR